jgi:hypothetical protein
MLRELNDEDAASIPQYDVDKSMKNSYPPKGFVRMGISIRTTAVNYIFIRFDKTTAWIIVLTVKNWRQM